MKEITLLKLETGDYPNIPVHRVQEACVEFAGAIEDMLWDYFALTGTQGVVVQSTDEIGHQAFWVEPKVSGHAYNVVTWHLTNEHIKCQVVDVDSNVSIPR